MLLEGIVCIGVSGYIFGFIFKRPVLEAGN